MYSKPRLLMTSTMKSEPGLSMVLASSTAITAGVAAGRARTGALAFLVAGAGSCTPASPGVAGLVTARAALAAAVFKKFRRSTDLVFGFFAMKGHLAAGFYSVEDEKAILEGLGAAGDLAAKRRERIAQASERVNELPNLFGVGTFPSS